MEHTISAVPHGHDDHGGHEALKIFGFWIFLVTDCLMFASLFALYLVLRTHTDGGPTAKELFDIPSFSTETFLLLISSFTSGLATLAMRRGNKKQLIGWLVVTLLLGLSFIGLEVREFSHMVSEGATISRSAFLTAFFTLVGTHGCHVSLGICWITGLLIQVSKRGITPVTERKLFIAGLYWHFLDVVWVFLYTIVYLMGVM